MINFLFLFNFSLYNLKVDEVEVENYSDTNFWSGAVNNVLPEDKVADILKELEL